MSSYKASSNGEIHERTSQSIVPAAAMFILRYSDIGKRSLQWDTYLQKRKVTSFPRPIQNVDSHQEN